MPVVPMTPTLAGAQPQAMPSEANLLMALAEMHKQGRFTQADSAKKPKAKPAKGEGPL